MAITQVGSGTTQVSTTASAVVNAPSGLVRDDVLFATILVPNVALTTVPTGWILYDTQPNPVASSLMRLWTYYKVATSSEPGTYTWGKAAGSTAFVVAVSAWRGVLPSAPIHTVSNQQILTTSAEPMTITGATTSIPGCRILFIRACRDTVNAAITHTAASGTEIYDIGNGISNQSYSIAMYDIGIQASAGATGTLAITANTTETHTSGRCYALNPYLPVTHSSVAVARSAMTRASNW